MQPIGILSQGLGWHVKDLIRAADELKLPTIQIDFAKLTRSIGCDSHDELDRCSALLVRTMPLGSLEQVIFRMDVLHEREQAGVTVCNTPKCLEICIDKYLTLVKLQKAGLPVPATHVSQSAEQAMEYFEKLGRDVVVKPIFGSEGRGMMRISDSELAWRTFRTLERSQAVIYQQPFIRHPGYDLRAFVLDGQIIAAMKRTSRDDWRTNCAQGAIAESVQLTSQQQEMALRSAKAIGGWAVGVDILPGPAGEEYVIEVNAVPGWRSLSPACGIDVAKKILKAIPQ